MNVLYNVDATLLSSDTRLNEIKFTKFIFNFPHTGGKMKIKQCKNLLQAFCNECKLLITNSDKNFYSAGSTCRDYYEKCEVIIPLCKGQGGTIFDETRNWEDTWKLVEMAGPADLVLRNVEYFDTQKLNHYSSIGFRSREQNFNTVKGIIHVLKLSLHPELNKYDTWVDLYKDIDSDIAMLMDMKQTTLLRRSIFSCIKNLFAEAVKLSKSDLEFETNFIIRKGFSSTEPEYPHLDPDKIYDLRVFHDPLTTKSFRTHPVEYNYLSDNTNFKTTCCTFLKNICDKINSSSSVVGTALPLNLSNRKRNDQVDKLFIVLDNCTTEDISLRNCVDNREEIVFEEYKTENADGNVVKAKYVFHLQRVAQFLSCSNDWQVIFSHENYVDVNNEILDFHFAQLSPVEYKFDINFTVQTQDYSHKKFFTCLWFIIPEMIQDVQLVNEHQNPLEPYKSYLYRIWYKSHDRPMYRKKVIHIHQNVVGKYLHSLLGVKVD